MTRKRKDPLYSPVQEHIQTETDKTVIEDLRRKAKRLKGKRKGQTVEIGSYNGEKYYAKGGKLYRFDAKRDSLILAKTKRKMRQPAWRGDLPGSRI